MKKELEGIVKGEKLMRTPEKMGTSEADKEDSDRTDNKREKSRRGNARDGSRVPDDSRESRITDSNADRRKKRDVSVERYERINEDMMLCIKEMSSRIAKLESRLEA